MDLATVTWTYIFSTVIVVAYFFWSQKLSFLDQRLESNWEIACIKFICASHGHGWLLSAWS